MPRYRGRFFQEEAKANYSAMAQSIANNKELIQDLIKQITLFRDSFLNDLKQSAFPRDQEDLLAAIKRSDAGLETLKKMELGHSVNSQEKELLVEYIKTMHITGAFEFEEGNAPAAP